MKRTLKWTVLAVAITAATAANAAVVNNIENNWTNNVENNVTNNVENNWTANTTHDVDTSYSDSFDRDTTVTHDVDTSYSDSFDKSTTIDKSYSDSFDKSTTIDKSYSESTEKNTTVNKNVDVDLSLNSAVNYERNVVDTDITHDEDVNIDHDTTIDKKVDEHGVSAELESDLSLTSDIDFTGAPTVSGDLEIDSAAIAVIDNRQTNSGNLAGNDVVTNDASIADNTATEASGNLQFNVAAGDNNQQDNAAALSAADASFAFGLADSKVFVQQTGTGNATANVGQTNTASVGDAAFASATGNIGVNVTSGNNNQQKNSLAASVATSRYASAAVSSNQISSGNYVSNTPKVEETYQTLEFSLSGAVTGDIASSGTGSYEGRGSAYQKDNFYLDTWDGALPHENGDSTGHIDMDNDIQNAVDNPYADGVGGIAFDTDEEGDLSYDELGDADLWASLSGTLQVASNEVSAYTTNTASLSGDAFANASGNIGVNVSAGTGNQQANSLSLAVAQPSAGGAGGGE